MFLDKSIDFLKSRKVVKVELPDIGRTVLIRELSIKQLAQSGKDLVAQLALMIVDEGGNQVFTTENDMANLAEMPSSISEKIFSAANNMAGITPASQEELVKN